MKYIWGFYCAFGGKENMSTAMLDTFLVHSVPFKNDDFYVVNSEMTILSKSVNILSCVVVQIDNNHLNTKVTVERKIRINAQKLLMNSLSQTKHKRKQLLL